MLRHCWYGEREDIRPVKKSVPFVFKDAVLEQWRKKTEVVHSLEKWPLNEVGTDSQSTSLPIVMLLLKAVKAISSHLHLIQSLNSATSILCKTCLIPGFR